jgi:hypothetical protein
LRDILTVVAGFLILVLAAALAVPPLVDWEARREAIDGAIARALGVEAATEGSIGIRLLPSPRIRADRIRLGGAAPDTPSFSASIFKAEIALTPLLRGEVRFTETRIVRAEIRLPAGRDNGWNLPQGFGLQGVRRDWALEDVSVSQLLVTTIQPATGRTDQFHAEGVHLEAQSLAGPWRMEGTTGGVPFRLASGELGQDRVLPLKLVGGGDAFPRFDIDARLALGPEGGTAAPTASGTAKLAFGPPAQPPAAGVPIPFTVQAAFKTSGATIELETLSAEAGEGTNFRLGGSGRIRLDEPRVSLKLESRRVDLDPLLVSASGQDLLSRLRAWDPPRTAVPIDLDLSLNSVGLAQDEITNVVLRASLARGRVEVERIEALAPGQTRITVSGEFGLTAQGGASGRIALASAASDRFGRYLGELGMRAPFLPALDGRPLEASADVVLTPPVTSLRNVRVKTGEATLTGNARYTQPEGAARGRLEAQVGLQGANLAELPQVWRLFDASRNVDLGLILDARDLRHGGRPGAGRIAARVLSDGPELVVEGLEIVDIAGANAQIAGRIGADGAGRIAGRVQARRAAPLLDLLGSVWIGGASRLAPVFLREGELDLAVTAERAPPEPGSQALRLKTELRGTAAGGRLEASVLSVDGSADNVTMRLATDHAGLWFQRADVAALRRPASLDLSGARVGPGGLAFSVAGDVAGLAIRTARPFALTADGETVESGEAELNGPDISPFLALLGGGQVSVPVPAQLRASLRREGDAPTLALSGRIAGAALNAQLAFRSRSEVSGDVSLDQLSAPWLVNALALGAPADTRAGAGWSTARFGDVPRPLEAGEARFKVARLDLGRGHLAQDASFRLELSADGVALRELEAGLAGGRLSGAVAITRQGSRASLIGEGTLRNAALPDLAGAPAIPGRVSGNVRFGAAGESMAALVSNLSGNGEVALDDLVVPKADPAAIDRALARVLGSADPLAPDRLEAALAEELDRGPLRSSIGGPATLVGGAMRIGPVSAEAGPGTWQGNVGLDFKTSSLDARGVLGAQAMPKGWVGAAPSIGLGWRGPLSAPSREVEAGALTGGVAAVVLRRELEKIEAFEAEANEQARRTARREFDRVRREAAEAAARLNRLREQQAEAERARARFDPIGSVFQPSYVLPPPLPQIDIAPAPRARTQPPPGG